MSGKDRTVDPETGDWILDESTGEYETSKTIQSALQHAIRIPKGSFWADPARGSRFEEIRKNGAANQATATELEDALRSALQRFEDAGLISDIDIQSTVTGTRVTLDSTALDASGREIDITKLTRFK